MLRSLAISGFNGNGLLGIHSIRLPRLCVSRPLVSCDDVLDFVLGALFGSVSREPDVRDAELVCIFDLLAELGRGRRHVRRDATGAQLVGDQVGRGAVGFIPYRHEHGCRRHTVGVRARGVQHVGDQAGQADGQAHARVLLVALRCEVVVTAAGADGTQSGGAVEERLIHGTGVVIKTTGDFQIGDHGARTDARGLVDDHRQRVESLACQHVGVGIRRDVMLGAQCVELVGQFLAVGGGQLGQFEAGTGLGFVGAAAFDEQLGHLIGADLVELVDLTQHAFDIRVSGIFHRIG